MKMLYCFVLPMASMISIASSTSSSNINRHYFFKFDANNINALQNGMLSSKCKPWNFDSQFKIWKTCNNFGEDAQCFLERPQFPVRQYKPKNLIVNISARIGLCNTLDTTCVQDLLLTLDLVIYYKHDLKPSEYSWRIQRSVGQGVGFEEIRNVTTESPALINAMYFRISPENFCGSVLAVSIYSFKCSKIVEDLVTYPEVSADPIVPRVTGRCIANAIPISNNPMATCFMGAGKYGNFTGKCHCVAGYSLKDGVCQACKVDEFKVDVGNQLCSKCGKNSRMIGGKLCRCLPDFYRKTGEEDSFMDDCYPAKFFGNCPRESMVRNAGEAYIFPETIIGHIINVSCVHGLTLEAKSRDVPTVIRRACVKSSEDKGKWQHFNMSICKESIPNTVKVLHEVEISNETVVSVSTVLSNITSNTSSILSGDDYNDVTVIMKKCLDVDGRNTEVTGNILKSINNILQVDKTIIAASADSSTRMLNIIDSVAEKNIYSSLSFAGDNFGFAVTQTDSDNDLYTNVVSSIADDNSRLEIKFFTQKDLQTNNTLTGIFIPKMLFKEKNLTSASIYAYAFKEDSFFSTTSTQNHSNNNKINKTKHRNGGKNVVSHILSMTVFNTTVKDLKKPVVLTFEVDAGDTSVLVDWTCSYWKTQRKGKHGMHWSTDGCRRSNVITRDNKTFVTCECNHLTNFAVLFNVYNKADIIFHSNAALNLASLIGCALSIVCLIATLICYLGLREIRKHTVRKIVINFCFSLLCLLVTFVFGVDVVDPQWACYLIATLIHMFTLSTFFWMGVQAVFLYKKAVRATKNRGESRKTYNISFCLSWGLPVLIAGITAAFNKQQSNDDASRSFCVIYGAAFIYGTLIPVCIVLFTNFVLFLPVIRKIQLHLPKRSVCESSIHALWRRTRVTISCSTLLGLTWIFGFFAVGDLRVVFHWLFCITNTLQGLFLFLFHVVLNDKVTHAWKKIILATSGTDSSTIDHSSRDTPFRFKSDLFRTLRRESNPENSR